MADFTKEEVLALAASEEDMARMAEADARDASNPTWDMKFAREHGIRATALRALTKSMDAEPAGYVYALEWRGEHKDRSEQVIKITRAPQPRFGFTVPIYTAPPASALAEPVAALRLRELLRPFADIADQYDDREDDNFCVCTDSHESDIRDALRLGRLRAIRSALAKQPAPVAVGGAAAPAAEDLLKLIRWAYETLYEINPSNYDHDEVCRLNDASVEVILGLKPLAAPQPASQNGEER